MKLQILSEIFERPNENSHRTKHHAEKRITFQLVDCVKVNYGKFGNLFRDVINIHGVAHEVVK
jgi:aspartate aminotransferase-like enzyme